MIVMKLGKTQPSENITTNNALLTAGTNTSSKVLSVLFPDPQWRGGGHFNTSLNKIHSLRAQDQSGVLVGARLFSFPLLKSFKHLHVPGGAGRVQSSEKQQRQRLIRIHMQAPEKEHRSF